MSLPTASSTTGVVVTVGPAGLLGDTTWDAFVVAAGGRHAQTTAWARVKSTTGWSAARVEVSTGGAIVAGAQVAIRKLPVVGRVGYLDGGPLSGGSIGIDEVVDGLIEVCRRDRLRNLVVDPPAGSERVVDRLKACGFVASQVKTALAATLVVDLTRSESEILAAMRSSTRRNIGKGERAGTSVRRGGREDLPLIGELFEATARRQGFVAAEGDYLEALFDELDPLGQCLLMIAEVEGVAVAAMLAITFGDRFVYKRGGWSGTHGDWRPNEVLHWAAMRWAKASGLREYDFDGIEPDVARAIVAGGEGPEATHVTRFKLGFGGEVVLLPDSLAFIPNRLVRLGYTRLFPRIRRWGVVKRVVKKLRSR
jgi:lipid II:glycine glycyltransferase (peptidoglycan interpeptide bridge formation enzyme)